MYFNVVIPGDIDGDKDVDFVDFIRQVRTLFFLCHIIYGVKQFTSSHELRSGITKINREMNIMKDIYDY